MDSPDSSISAPGYQALVVAKNTPDLVVFKKPTDRAVKSKKSKSKILDEDTYIKEVGEIIERDFFPYLKNLKVQNEYLDALEQNNVIKTRQVYERYSSDCPIPERLASPATFETPFREHIDVSRVDVRECSPRSMTAPQNCNNKTKTGLDTYFCTHTSEDNASFEEMMRESEQRQRIKYSWLYEEKSSIQSIESEKTILAIGRKNGKEPMNVSQFTPDSWGYRNKNFIMYVPEGVQLTSNEKIEIAKRKREVRHENTRLIINPFNEKQNKETISEMAKAQIKSNDGKIGVDGKEVVKNPTPKINGFAFVATPSPRPGEYDSPLMTWGQIEDTPFRLDNGNTPLRMNQGPSFRMAEPPKREKLAMQLAEKAGERHRDRKNKALEAARKSLATSSPKTLSTIDRFVAMSPAARRLATQKLRIVNTPTPRKTAPRTPTIGIKMLNYIPHWSTSDKSPTKKSSSRDLHRSQAAVLTDNLLNLPSRNRAADFFN